MKLAEPKVAWKPPSDGLRRWPLSFARFDKMVNFEGSSEAHISCVKTPTEVGVSYLGFVVPDLQSLEICRFVGGTYRMSRLVPFTRIDEYALA